jgi:hypothetical protein
MPAESSSPLRLDDDVVVRRQEAERDARPVVPTSAAHEGLEKRAAIGVVEEERALHDAARVHVKVAVWESSS